MMLGKNKWIALSGKNGLSAVTIGALILVLAQDASAQVTAYPAQGQSPEQQEMDKAACQDFAKSQTGFDPQQALSQAGSQSNQTPPPAVRARKRAREEQAELSQQNQQKAQMEKKLQAYNKAEATCLKGKGYSVG
jgi:pyruvate/2-oxoglutarate dehydrogenase complex dihydrolipoamide acyltransferase (E2) component